MKRLLTLIAILLTAFGTLLAQTSFKMKAPSRVVAGSKFAVTFTLRNAEGTSMKVPQINGCTLLYGPSTSTSQSYEVINGRMSSSSQIDYTYYYRAEEEGTYTIGEASIVVDGKKLTTDPAKITVVENPQGSSSSQGSSQQAPVNIDDISTQSSDRAVNADDVFVRIILSKSSAYEQEAIECTIKLYTKYSISSFMPTKQPSFDGCLIQELDLQPALNEVESYKGQNYMTAILKKCIIFPQKSGHLTINSGNYDIKVVQYDTVNMGFFSVRNPQERSIKVSSNSAAIDIKPLPFPQPDGFTGAVGKFSIDSRLVGNNFRTNEPATLIYTINGTGNIKYVKEPVIDFPSEFEQYTPKSDIDAEVVGNTVTGTMTVEYTFVPQSVGDFHIGSDTFVYFDPTTKEYVPLTTPSYNIKVAKGVSTASDVDRKDISAKNTDILHIHTGEKHPKLNRSLVIDEWWYWLLYAIVAGGLISAVGIYRRNITRAADVKGRRLAKANKAARQRLRLAKKYADEHNDDKFIEETLRALWGYLSDKLGMPASQLNRQNISAELQAVSAPEEVINKVISALDDCEMARYTPTAQRESSASIYAKATEAIDGMESIKLNKKSAR